MSTVRSPNVVRAAENIRNREELVWDLILRATAANLRKNQLVSELSAKLSQQEWSGCTALYAAITRVSEENVALLLEVSRMAPDTILVSTDPRRPGYLSVTYLPRPQIRFHVPDDEASRFKN
jgi:hypothetical protein